MGTTVTKGKCKGVIINTGKSTEIGKIAESLSSAKKTSTKLEQVILLINHTKSLKLIPFLRLWQNLEKFLLLLR